jgi:hypothetical protein
MAKMTARSGENKAIMAGGIIAAKSGVAKNISGGEGVMKNRSGKRQAGRGGVKIWRIMA